MYWAGVFEVGDAELWPVGVHPTFVESGWDGVYVMRVGQSVRLRAPRHLRSVIEPLVQDVSVDGLMNRSLWSVGLSERRPIVLGPASHFLADSPLDGGDGATPVEPGHASAFAAGLTPAELEESGVSEGVALFGVSVDGQLAAIASLTEWAGAMSDVGVITQPLFRGRGLGQTVATAALNDAISRCGFARWRAREDNLASIRLAKRLGLAFYGTNLGIRLS